MRGISSTSTLRDSVLRSSVLETTEATWIVRRGVFSVYACISYVHRLLVGMIHTSVLTPMCIL